MECCELSRLNTSDKVSLDDALLDFKRTGKYRSTKEIESQKKVDDFNLYIDDFESFSETEKRKAIKNIENTMFRNNDPFVFSFEASSENKATIRQEIRKNIYEVKKQSDGTYDIYKNDKVITAGDKLFFGKIGDSTISETVMSALNKFSKDNSIENAILLSSESLNDAFSRKDIEIDTNDFFSFLSDAVKNVKDYSEVYDAELVQKSFIESKEEERERLIQKTILKPLLNKYLNTDNQFSSIDNTFKALILKAKETDRLEEFLTDAKELLKTNANEKNLPMVAFYKLPLIVEKNLNIHDTSSKVANILLNNYINEDKPFHKTHSLVYNTSIDNSTRKKFDELMSDEYGQTLLQQFRGYGNSNISNDRLYQNTVASIIRELKINKYESLDFYIKNSPSVKSFVSSVEKLVIESNKKTKSINNLSKTTFKNIDKNILDTCVERAKDSIKKIKTFSINTPLSSLLENTTAREEEDFVPTPRVSKAEKIAEKLSKTLGVEYEFVSIAQAKSMTNEPNAIAFFKDNKVYFVKERIDESSAFHEFCHPFVRTLINKNPKLAKNLYDALLETSNGESILQEVLSNYPEIADNTDRIMEECLVKAMQKSNDNKRIVSRIIASIKQIIRSIFPKKLNLDNLSENTTLEELVDLLNSGVSIAIDTFDPMEITAFDKVVFSEANIKKIEKEIKKTFFKTTNASKLHDDIIDIYLENLSIFTKQTLKKLEDKNYKYIKSALKDNENNNLFLQLLGDIQDATTKLGKNKAIVSLDDMITQKTRGIIKSLIRTASISEALLEYSELLSSASSRNEQVKNLFLYKNIVSGLYERIEEAKRIFPLSGTSLFQDKAEFNLFAKVEENLAKSSKNMDKKFYDLAEAIVLAQSEGLSDNINAQFEREIQKYNKKSYGRKLAEIEYYGMPLDEYNRLHDLWTEYLSAKELRKREIINSEEFRSLAGRIQHSLKIEPWVVQMYLMGFDGISPIEKEFRPAMESSSPVMGAVASYIKSAITNGVNLSFQQEVDFSNRISKLLNKAGYGPNRVGNLGEKLMQIDRIAVKDENGELVEKKVFSFLNEFKDYRYSLAVERKTLQDKKDKWLNADYATRELFHQDYLKAKDKFDTFLNTFFNRENITAIYTLDKRYFNDKIGIEAKAKRDAILEQINDLMDKDLLTGSNSEDEIKDLRKTSSLLGCIYDQNGELKTGNDFEIAKRISEYNIEASKYYTYTPNDEYISKLFTEYINLHPNDVDGFITSHFHAELSDETSLKRQQIFEELAMMKKQLTLRPGYTRESNFETLIDMVKPLRDELRVPNPNSLSFDKLLELKALEETEKDNYINLLGLTKKETEEFKPLHFIYNNKSDDGSQKFQKYKNLLSIVNKYGSLVFYEREQQISKDLYGITTSKPSEYFFGRLQEIIDNICVDPETAKRLGQYQNAESFYQFFLVYKKTIDGVYKNRIDEFPTYLDENDQIHIIKFIESTFVQKEDKDYPTLMYCWNKSIPLNDKDKKTYKLYDSDGVLIKTVTGTPNTEYCTRDVKAEFKTPKIEGKTIDVHGNWLPKSKEQLDSEIEYDDNGNVISPINDLYRFINMDYLNMDKTTHLYTLLEELKRIYLEWQEGKPDQAKLGYDYPRMRKGGLEVYEKSLIGSKNKEDVSLLFRLNQNLKRLAGKKIEDKVVSNVKDSVESGLNYVAANNLMAAGIISNPDGKNIPILGLTDLDIREVSTDIIKTMFDYTKSLNIYTELKRVYPQISAIDHVLHSEKSIKNEDFNKVVEQFEYLVKREFQGLYNEGGIMNHILTNQIYEITAKVCTLSFFALNPKSSIKNAVTQIFQTTLEALTFRNMTPFDFAVGMAKGLKYTLEQKTPLVGKELSMGELPLDIQFAMVCDINQGTTASELGKRFTDTRFKQILAGKPLSMGRKFLENIAVFGAGFSSLYHVKVNRYRVPNCSASSLKQVRLTRAFEKGDNGLIRLKDGFDVRLNYVNTVIDFDNTDTFKSLAEKYCVPEEVIKIAFDNEEPSSRFRKLDRISQKYQKKLLDSRSIEESDIVNKEFVQEVEDASPVIENTLFKYYINRHHEVMNRMGGTYAQFDTAKFQSKLLGKAMSFLRKYFLPMASRRLETGRMLKIHTGGSFKENLSRSYAESFTQRRNFGIGGVEQSVYVGLLKGLTDFVLGRRNKQTLHSLLFVASEMTIIYLFQQLIYRAWKFIDYDDDEDKEYDADRSGIVQQVKKETSPIPIPYLISEEAYSEKNRPGVYTNDETDMGKLINNWLKYEAFDLAVSTLGEMKSLTFAPETMLTSIGYGVYFDMPIHVQWATSRLSKLTSDDVYTRAVGPYFWQQKGSQQNLKPIFGAIGLSGTFLDPYYGVSTTLKYQYDVYNKFYGREMRNIKPSGEELDKEELKEFLSDSTHTFFEKISKKHGIDKTVTPSESYNLLKQYTGESYDASVTYLGEKPPSESKKKSKKKSSESLWKKGSNQGTTWKKKKEDKYFGW